VAQINTSADVLVGKVVNSIFFDFPQGIFWKNINDRTMKQAEITNRKKVTGCGRLLNYGQFSQVKYRIYRRSS